MSHSPSAQEASPAAPKRQLTLFDSTCIIVGIIVGATIYESGPLIANTVDSPWKLIGLWLAVGLLTLIGAMCYAELGSSYPEEGGDYAYLTRAFGRRWGFLFAWAQLWIVRPGSIGAMAYVLATYANRIGHLWAQFSVGRPGSLWAKPYPVVDHLIGVLHLPTEDRAVTALYAAGSVVLLTIINLLGIQLGKWTQNLLTVVKMLGLLAIVAVGLFCSHAPVADVPTASASASLPLVLGLIMVFYAYSGWNEMAYVGAEVRNPERNILRALVWGTLATIAVYLLVNLAFVRALGFAGLQHSHAVAADVLASVAGRRGELAISILICISVLGVINGMIFTGSRIYYAMGRQHALYGWLGRWNQRAGAPVPSLLVQGVITVGLILMFGLWHEQADRAMGWCLHTLFGLQAAAAEQATARGGFEKLVIFTSPVFWFFLLLVGLSVFELRQREPVMPRPYRVPLYPFVPYIFCLSSTFMLYKSTEWAIDNRNPEALWSIGIMAVGLLLSLYDPKRSNSTAS